MVIAGRTEKNRKFGKGACAAALCALCLCFVAQAQPVSPMAQAGTGQVQSGTSGQAAGNAGGAQAPYASEAAAQGVLTAGAGTPVQTMSAVKNPAAGQAFGPGEGMGLVDSSLKLGGATITMLKGNEQGQQLCIVIQGRDGKVVVVDGGTDTNRSYLANYIKNNTANGRVDCWLLTHPHADHVGALTALLMRQHDAGTPADDYSKFEIGDIYYSFAPVDFYEKYEPSYRIPPVKEAYAALSLHDPAKLHYNSPRGTQIQVGEIRITVMNELFECTENAGNNSSVAYMIDVGGKKLLVLGDMPYEGALNLMSLWQPQDLKADIVQMAHHGQHGGSPEFYRTVDPEWCLWPTHAALWAQRNDAIDESSDSYTIAKTMKWMEELGVKRSYAMCEGDWTLR